MSRVRLVRGLFAVVSVAFFAFALSSAEPPQTPTSQTQGVAFLQKALVALAPSTPISDISVSGTARRIAGSDDESGPVVIKALAGIGSRVDFILPSGPLSEIRNNSSGPAGSWSGPDGVSHSMAYHNLLTDPGWSPAFAIAAVLSAQNAVVTYAGTETRNGLSVIHVSASQRFLPASVETKLMQHLTETEIYLDTSTNLPASITFNTHADDNALVDIPVEIWFSEYRTVNGATIPFHIQKFLNNSLFLDIEFDSATLNSGLASSTFSVGAAQ